jgi:hypothetical protein
LGGKMQVQTESFPRNKAMREGGDSSGEKATDDARRAMQPAAVAGRASASLRGNPMQRSASGRQARCCGAERWSPGAGREPGPCHFPARAAAQLLATGAAPAMPCKSAPDAAGRRMPYERAEASLCRTIGQHTLDAQRGLLLHLGVLGMLGPFNLEFDFRRPSASRGSQYLTLIRRADQQTESGSLLLAFRPFAAQGSSEITAGTGQAVATSCRVRAAPTGVERRRVGLSRVP